MDIYTTCAIIMYTKLGQVTCPSRQTRRFAMHAKLTKLVIVGLLAGSMLTSNRAIADDGYKNFKSLNFQDRFIRHRNFLIYLEPANSALALNDSAFKVVRGLAGSCNSFESKNFPRFYIRHQDFRLKLNKFENKDLFRRDATFCIRKGLANPEFSSFESLNYPGRFMRHQNFEFHIHPNDGSDLFKKDATFIIQNAAQLID
jgi:hypothetical protein